MADRVGYAGFRKILMFCIALCIGLQYNFFDYKPIVDILGSLSEYVKYDIILPMMITGGLFLGITWYYVFSIVVGYIDCRLPLFIRPYVFPLVTCCAILNFTWHIYRRTI